VIALSDVTTPLLGPKGSARVFGPQKGAAPAQVRRIEEALAVWARALNRDLGVSVAAVPGAGAAGGLGSGLLAFARASIVPGSDWILEKTGALPDTRGQEPTPAAADLWARVPGEAAAFLLLEEAATARGRGAHSYGELVSLTEGGESTAADWRCGDTQAAGPILDLLRLILTLQAESRYAAAQDDESLTVTLRPA